MKIRNAFVSNSSSCSFIIGGVNLGPNAEEGVVFNPASSSNPKGRINFDCEAVIEEIIDGKHTYTVVLTSPDGQETSFTAEPGDHLLTIDDSGIEPEYDDNTGDYVETLDYFSNEAVEIYDRILEYGGKAFYGACDE